MRAPLTTTVRALAATIVMLGLAACGSGNQPETAADEGQTSGGEASKQVLSEDLAALVPERFRDGDPVLVATTGDYAPKIFTNDNGELEGVFVDLGASLGQILGVTIEFETINFDAIIPALAAERYDVGWAGQAPTNDRMKVVDFVTDTMGYDALMVRADDESTFPDRMDLCGTVMGVLKGSYEQGVAEALTEQCVDEGRPAIEVNVFPAMSDSVQALSSSRIDVVMAVGSSLSYIDKQQSGVFKVIEEDLFPESYALEGLAFPKDSDLVDPIHQAMDELIENGTYTDILEKWGIEGSAIKDSEINPKVDF